ncbi:MAG: NAD-dependent epimerase/dehydratase family protein [Nocardioides sp.]
MGDEPCDSASPGTARDPSRILISGGAGLLGTGVIDILRARGLAVAVLDDGSGGTHDRLDQLDSDPMIRVHRVDLRDVSAVAEACRDESPSMVVHLAGRHFIPYCNAHPEETWEVNVDGTRNLLAAIAPNPPQRLVFASTADVYRPALAAHREAHPLESPTIYGRSKLAAEQLLVASCATSGVPLTIARLFNLYGPHHTVDHLIPTVVAQAIAGNHLDLGDLTTLRDFVYVDDAAAAIVDLLTEQASGIYNVGTGTAASGEDVVGLVGKLLNRELNVVRDQSRLRTHDRAVLVADPSKLRSLLRWWPATPLDEGLRKVIAAQGHAS